uniref:Uncharacterized protein n=1 Tax=Sphaerodactylus townsendi TaxID=933632 RepID=A0ACB8FIY6_9SAUR
MNPEESAASLKAILEHSLFSNEKELLAELDAIIGKKGTRIIIWNLRREKNEQTEFDFDSDKYDIRIPADLDEVIGKRGYKKQERQDQITPESDYSLRANNTGVGVVGIIECNFLKPTHNKQDFDYTHEYRLTIHALGEKLNDYWNEMQAKKKDYPLDMLVEDIQKRPDQTWVQCDSCLKWRKVPDGIDHLPEKWYCSYNPDPQFRNCNVPEEPEDDDLIPYEKTFKKKDREKLKKRLEMTQQMYNEIFIQTSPTMSSVSPASSESISRLHTEASNTSLTRPLNTSNNMSVSSPHPDPENSFKRKLSDPVTQLPYKISRLNSSHTFEHKKDDPDDDVIILEENSTPKPSGTDCDITIVKVEGGVVDHILDHIDLQEESSKNYDASSEDKCSKGNAATQTEKEQLVVKKEEMDSTNNQLSRSESELTLLELDNVAETAPVDNDLTMNELRIQLQLANEEKEKYHQQCDTLLKQVKILEQKTVEINDKSVKKEMCHQSTDTQTLLLDELEKIKGRSSEEILILYEQALQEMKRLKEQCDTLQSLKSEYCKCSNSENKSEVDDMAVQLDDVFRQLDKCSIERDQYKNEIELLEMEKSQLGFQCEELKTEVAQLKTSISHANDSVASNLEDPVNYPDGESLKLRSLRINVGQLLATIMPDLDLQQMNYNVDVVDEILGQVVEQMHEISSA